MNTITIPKKLAEKGDLVVIPRREYEALLQLTELRQFTPTAAQKKALMIAEKNFQNGKTFSAHELAKKLGFTN